MYFKQIFLYGTVRVKQLIEKYVLRVKIYYIYLNKSYYLKCVFLINLNSSNNL